MITGGCVPEVLDKIFKRPLVLAIVAGSACVLVVIGVVLILLVTLTVLVVPWSTWDSYETAALLLGLAALLVGVWNGLCLVLAHQDLAVYTEAAVVLDYYTFDLGPS